MVKNALAKQLFLTANTVKSVLAGKSLSESLNELPQDEKPGVQAISFYIMRNLGFAHEMRSILVRKKPSNRLLEAFLLVGLCLLEASLRQAEGLTQAPNTPIYQEYTLVDQLVTAATFDSQTKFNKALLNAVLRRYSRERDVLLTKLGEPAIWNHPDWWIKEIRSSWPKKWQQILQQANQQPPMHLRVNTRKTTVREFTKLLDLASIEYTIQNDYCISLKQALPVGQIPAFRDGIWSVQDISAQKAATLLPLENNMRVLDACAAPGGKTAHMLELYDLHLTAIDNDDKRLQRVEDNLQRLNLLSENINLKCADVSDLKSWWDGENFDAILADVPCTGSGVVRRHPDIRWLRRAQDIKKTAALQIKIIDSLWQTLAINGHMLYVTCSIFPQEGEQQINKFLTRHKNAKRLPAPGQILPDALGDGFFYALIQKQA